MTAESSRYPGPSTAAESSDIKLRKQITLFDGIGIIVGVIIGAGIFVSPKGVLLYSGSIAQATIVWILCGVLSTIGALCYAEMGTMIPKSGGDYAYIGFAFGPLPGFLYLWICLIILLPTANAITALTFAQYLLQPFIDPPYESVQLLAALITCFVTIYSILSIIGLLTAINCYNVKWVTRVTDIFTATKMIALIIIIIAGIWYFALGNTENWNSPFSGSHTSPGFIALAFYNGLFSFSGWNYLNFVTEELINPFKNLPRAICISMPIVTAIYVMTNVAYFTILTPDAILASEAVALTFGNKILGFMAWIMPFSVACSTFGSLNSAIFAASRVFFVGARNGHLPAAISLINMYFMTPMPSLILICILSIVLLLVRNVYSLINYVSFVESFFTFITISGLLWLRRSRPNIQRPIKISLVLPITYLIICGFLVLSSCYVSPIEVGVGSALIIAGIPIYYVAIRYPSTCLTKMSKGFLIWCQKLFLCMPNQEKLQR